MSDKSGPNQESKANQMSFLEHLEVLRWILMRVVVVVAVLGTVVFIYRDFVMKDIIFASIDADFPTYKLFCKSSHILHEFVPSLVEAEDMCFQGLDPYFFPTKVTGKFMTAMMVALIGGAIISFPYIIWEIWRFLKPALYPKEQKNAKGIVFFTSLLFIAGILFGYFVINPLSVHFLIGFELGYDKMLDNYPLNSFIGIVASTTLATGVMFELPILAYFLSRAGLLTPAFMKQYRKHAFVLTLLLSAIITPPDVFSQILVTIPIVILYEISILISARVNKKKA